MRPGRSNCWFLRVWQAPWQEIRQMWVQPVPAPKHINENWPPGDIPSSGTSFSSKSEFKIHLVFFLLHSLSFPTLHPHPQSLLPQCPWGAATTRREAQPHVCSYNPCLYSGGKHLWFHSPAPSKFYLPNIKLFSMSCVFLKKNNTNKLLKAFKRKTLLSSSTVHDLQINNPTG